MNIESISRKALTILKLKYGLPKRGFLAGGSLANTIWGIISGNKPVINDIDIFLYSNEKEKEKEKEDPENTYFECYLHITGSSENDSYIIRKSETIGNLNFINYESVNPSPYLIISSFDINCTQVGYSIEEDKFYWTDDFIKFLDSGELKISNLNTPAHTAIRILKKKNELNAHLNQFEIEICQYVLNNRSIFSDIRSIRFMQKYADMYIKNENYLNNFFTLKRDFELERHLNKNEKVFFMETSYSTINMNGLSNIPNTLKEFLFYIRNIYKNQPMYNLWDKLYPVYLSNDYINNNTPDEIEFISNFIKKYPQVIANIKGITLSEQIYIIRNVMEKVSIQHDYNTAIAVLENIKLSPDKIFDDDECLLLGLSVRKKTKNNTPINLNFLSI